jgi:hypothetical protein
VSEGEEKKETPKAEEAPAEAPAAKTAPESEAATGESQPPQSEGPTASEKPQGPGEAKEEPQAPPLPPGPAWEDDLDVYPLREKTEDPRWAVRTVWIWVVVALASLAFILTLLVLGIFYD